MRRFKPGKSTPKPKVDYPTKLRRFIGEICYRGADTSEEGGALYFDAESMANVPDWTNEGDVFECVCRIAEETLETDNILVERVEDGEREAIRITRENPIDP